MSFSSPSKLHKRSAPSRTGSEFSGSTQYSSSSTLLEDWFPSPPAQTPTKPWAIKALNHLGLKCKKSMVFGKGKKKEVSDKLEEGEEEMQYDPFKKTPLPFVIGISQETVERIKQKDMEEIENPDLLPECPPQMLRRAPSSTLVKAQATKQRSQLTNMRSGSTPNLGRKFKRDSLDDPFYLETILHEFPRPPVHHPGEYAPRAPVNPRMRRQNSNFSLPSSRAYPERKTIQPKHWIDRPVQVDAFRSREPTSFKERSGYGQPSVL